MDLKCYNRKCQEEQQNKKEVTEQPEKLTVTSTQFVIAANVKVI